MLQILQPFAFLALDSLSEPAIASLRSRRRKPARVAGV